MIEIRRMKISDMKPHPKNAEIYGQNEDVSDLVEKIKRSGQVHTLVVTSKGIVLAGHRRMRACEKLGIKEVEVEIRDFDTPEQEIEYIIDNNATREKTNEQKGREAIVLKETLSVLAKKRKLNNLRQNQSSEVPEMAQRGKTSIEVPNLALRDNENGKTRDIIAPKVGLRSGADVDRAIKTIKKIDELKEEGRTDDAELLRDVMNNRGVSAAENLAKNIDVVKNIPENEREAIKEGKKSPNAYILKADNKQKRNSSNENDSDTNVGETVKNESIDNVMSDESDNNYLAGIQDAVAQSSKTIVRCLEELLSKRYLKSNKREVTDKTQSKIRSYLEAVDSIQALVASMEIKGGEVEVINLRETEME